MLHSAVIRHVHIGNNSPSVRSTSSVTLQKINDTLQSQIRLIPSSGTHASYNIQPNITKTTTAGDLTPPA